MTRPGCFNRPPLRESHQAQDGYHQNMASRIPRMVQVPHRNTTDCQFTKLNPNYAGCTGCCHQEPAK